MKRALVPLAAILMQGCSMFETAPAPDPDPQPGVALSLARERTRNLSDIHYTLAFDLQRGMDAVSGTVRIAFTATESGPVVLDFDGEALDDLLLDGAPVESRRVANHLVIHDVDDGEHILSARIRSRVAATGTPLTVYRDPSDGTEYLYTLVVPADAHRLFPCFDQPDLKARFSLSLNTPGDWVAVANGIEAARPTGDRRQWTFTETPALPTYLFAFAAGPFSIIEDPEARPADPKSGVEQPLRIFLRASKLPHCDRKALFDLHLQSVQHQEEYFQYRYPFRKLDIVLCPGFPYGGMEHAGAIFYRESSLVFDHQPTELELLRRSSLIYHEVSHQWFGNLVTMRWFDDLWLKEGFATFIGYRTLHALEPERRAWMRFHQRVKPAAFRIDATEGTTPIWQRLDNLGDAKSAYGPIVYNKAPAILRELEARLGPGPFRKGVRTFLRDHAFGNATWRDLLQSLEDAAETELAPWSESWILGRGMPRVQVQLETNSRGLLESAKITQEDVLGHDRTWPLTTSVLCEHADGSRETFHVRLDSGSAELLDLRGKAVPAFLLPNADGVAYAQVVLADKQSRDRFLALLPSEADPMVKATGFSALWDSVREGICPPQPFVDTCLAMLERERDPQTHAVVASALGTTLRRYLPAAEAAGPRRRASRVFTQLLGEPWAAPIRLQVLLRMARTADDPQSFELIENILDGSVSVPDLDLGIRDQFVLVTALIAAQRPGSADRLERLEANGKDVARWSYQARAATPTAETKAKYFGTYLEGETPPEQWVLGSLGAFHWPGQEALTLPYLGRALDAAPWVKENRKIFFMPAWLEAFLGAHGSPEALAVVEEWLAAQPGLAPDIRRKLLVPLHELRRAVRIRGTRR